MKRPKVIRLEKLRPIKIEQLAVVTGGRTGGGSAEPIEEVVVLKATRYATA